MILHRKRIPQNRPDEIDATVTRGISNWNADHDGPIMLAYHVTMGAQKQIYPTVGGETEIPNMRSRFDFTYVRDVRILVGANYGACDLTVKYSSDLTDWHHFDGVNGPNVSLVQGNANPTIYVSAWVALNSVAKADRWIAPFYRSVRSASLVQLGMFAVQVR